MTPRLIAQWKVTKRHGRTALCAYADFGKSLRQVYGLYKIEKDCGDRTDTWAEWLKQHLGISLSALKRCREVSTRLELYPGLRRLSLSHTEVYNRREGIRDLLESPGAYKTYWSKP